MNRYVCLHKFDRWVGWGWNCIVLRQNVCQTMLFCFFPEPSASGLPLCKLSYSIYMALMPFKICLPVSFVASVCVYCHSKCEGNIRRLSITKSSWLMTKLLLHGDVTQKEKEKIIHFLSKLPSGAVTWQPFCVSAVNHVRALIHLWDMKYPGWKETSCKMNETT